MLETSWYRISKEKYTLILSTSQKENSIEPLNKARQELDGTVTMRECVWHVAAALLSFLSWMYCVNVMSDKHAVDTTTELQFALLLLTSLCLTWAVVCSFKTHHRVEPPPTTCDTEGEQLNKHKGNFDQENYSSHQSKPLLDYNEKQCYSEDMERTIVVESEKHEVVKAETPNTNANCSLNRSNSDRSEKLFGSIILTSQTLLVITGVQTLKMLLHFFLKYRILFCQKDLLIAVHMPVCICVIEVSVAVVYLLRTYLCKEETDDVDKTQKTILIS